MPERTTRSAPSASSLPDAPNLDWLRKQAKHRLDEMRSTHPKTKLAEAQFDLAKQYGFSSWRALKSHIDSLTAAGQLFDAAQNGDVDVLATLLDKYPDKLHARAKPYEWSLLHAAAHKGHLAAVDLLLRRGLDVNTREKGDNTYAMHWAAAAGHLEVVRRLADAGGDVAGQGDDHALEIIGWATCWDECDDAAHRAVAAFLVSRGARHHIFSAIAMNLEAEVRRIAADAPATLNSRMSRNENQQLPLHFAVRMNRPEMVSLLLELGADALGTDSAGYTAAIYATDSTIDRPLLAKIRDMMLAEMVSSERGRRQPRGGMADLVALLALGDWETAALLLRDIPQLIELGGATSGVLHVMGKRGDERAVRWLLDHGADPNALWPHWDAEVTPLHLAASRGHADVVGVLLAAGADPSIRDSKHDGDAIGWASFFQRPEIVQMLKSHVTRK